MRIKKNNVLKRKKIGKSRGGAISSADVYNKIADVVTKVRGKYIKYKDYVDPTIEYGKKMYKAYRKRNYGETDATNPDQVNNASQSSVTNSCLSKCQAQCLNQGSGISQIPNNPNFKIAKNMNILKIPKNYKSNPTADPQIKNQPNEYKYKSKMASGVALMRGPIA